MKVVSIKNSLTLTGLIFVFFISKTLGQGNCNNAWRYGDGTFYGGVAGSSGGNCGLYVAPDDSMHAAMNQVNYDTANACGACVRVLGPKGEVFLRIVDRCPECKPGDIDMTPQAFRLLANPSDGRIPIQWQYAPCPISSTIKIYYQIGSSQWYTSIQIRDHKFPISKLEFRNSSGIYHEINREMYNYFVYPSGIDDDKSFAGPYTFRLTSVTGEIILINSLPFVNGGEVDSGIQFSPVSCPDCIGVMSGTAEIDNCRICSGGTTGVVPNSSCSKDCHNYWNGTAYLDGCGNCVSGATGATPCDLDCNGTPGGQAFYDLCNNCVGGATGMSACEYDCNGVINGTARIDSCGFCVGGNTGLNPSPDYSSCNKSGTTGIALGLTYLNATQEDIASPSPTTSHKLFIEGNMLQVSVTEMGMFYLRDLTGKEVVQKYFYEPGIYYIDLSTIRKGIYVSSIIFSSTFFTSKLVHE
jgi:expansin (peptidoglycan-binding protein)